MKTEFEDYKEECVKNKQSQQEEINTLQAKLSEIQEELKRVKASKESLKVSFERHYVFLINHFLHFQVSIFRIIKHKREIRAKSERF